MNKRKDQASGNNSDAKEERNLKQARVEEADDPAAASSSSSPSRFPTAAVVNQASRTSLLVSSTLKLIDAMESTQPLLECVLAVCTLLEAGTKGGECHFDMSMRADEDDVKSKPALFLLLDLISECFPRNEPAAAAARRKEATQVLEEVILPLFPTLLRAFDPSITDAKTGNNALHEFFWRMTPMAGVWSELVPQMVQRGVSVHARNHAGRTPLLMGAAGMSKCTSAYSFRLLQELGADINAQDNDGNSLLHHLIHRRYADVTLTGLFCSGSPGVSKLDLALENKHGQTALDLATRLPAQLESNRMRTIHQLLRVQTQAWHKKTRPLILQALTEPMIPDLAQLAMGYIDGSGPPFAAAEAAEEEK